MLQVAAILLLLCLAAETTRKFYQQRAVFALLGETTVAMWLVWLFPLPLLLPLLDRQLWLLFFPFPVAVVFFVPALAAAASNRRRFDKSGDDRVKPAAAAVDQLITFGIMGVAGMLVFTVWLWTRRH